MAPESPAGWEATSVLALFVADFEGSILAATKKIELQPTETDYFRRGMARFVLGDLDGALKDARKAEQTATSGEDEWYHALMAMVFLARNDARDTGERILRGLRHHGRGPHILPLAALHAARMGDLPRARALEARAKEVAVEYEKCWRAFTPLWRSAKLARPPGDVVGKAFCFELDLATQVPAEPPECHRLRARGEERFARGEHELALADASRALGEDPADGSARLLRARCLIRFGHLDQARADLTWVERMAPNRAEDLKRAQAEYDAARAEEAARGSAPARPAAAPAPGGN
jgi:tetratricopeptide (TPR) repeat protein